MWYEHDLKNIDTVNFCEKILKSNLKLTVDEKVDILNRLAENISDMTDTCFAIFKVKDNFNKREFVKDALDFKIKVSELTSRGYNHSNKFSDIFWKILKEKINFNINDGKINCDILDLRRHEGYREYKSFDFYILNVKQKDEKFAFKYLIYFAHTDAYPTGNHSKKPEDFKNSSEILDESLKGGVVKNLFNNHFDFLDSGFTSICKGKDYKQYFPNNNVRSVEIKDLS